MLFRPIVLTVLFLLLVIPLLSFANQEYLIPVPDDCLKVSKIEKSRIYLVKDESSCRGVPVVKLKLPDSIETVEIYVEGKLWKVHSVKDKNLEQSIARLNVKPDPSIKVPKNEEAERLAKEAYNYTQTEEYKKQVEKYKEQITDMLSPNQSGISDLMEKHYPEFTKKKNNLLTDDERVYVFVSSSVPEQTLRAYASDLQKLGKNAFMVLRGAIGGLKYLSPTAKWALSVLKKNPYCEGKCETFATKIVIDPFLFRKYGINEVPAIVYAKGIQNTEGLSEGLITDKNFYLVSYGDVALSYHLKMMYEKTNNQKFKLLSDILLE